MSGLLRALGIIGTVTLAGYALVLLFGDAEVDDVVADVIADARDGDEQTAEVERRRERVAQVARGMMMSPNGPDGQAQSSPDELAAEVPAPEIPYGSGELDPKTVRSSFDYAMDRVDAVANSRKRITVEDWDVLYREANDSFTALSIVLDATDPDASAELEEAYKRLKQSLKRVRVRGRKFGT
ncbi:MAG: hypothetical protein AB1Z98_00610 [Nannocystaceae bacterium]